MKRKFSYAVKGMDIFLMFLSFALALYDAFELKAGFHTILHSNNTFSVLIAFAVATVANTFALLWGMTNGRNQSKHIFNKKSAIGFAGWVFLGIVYCVVEVVAALSQENINWTFQIAQYVIMAVLYIFSGLAIQHSAREIWDLDASACRSSEAEFKIIRKQVAKQESDMNYMLTALENYNQNYEGLDEQYEKQLDAINHAEDSIINEILTKTLINNPSITPSVAREVVEKARKDFIGKR